VQLQLVKLILIHDSPSCSSWYSYRATWPSGLRRWFYYQLCEILNKFYAFWNYRHQKNFKQWKMKVNLRAWVRTAVETLHEIPIVVTKMMDIPLSNAVPFLHFFLHFQFEIFFVCAYTIINSIILSLFFRDYFFMTTIFFHWL